MAVQAEHADRWLEEEDQPLCRGRRLWMQGGEDQQPSQKHGLEERRVKTQPHPFYQREKYNWENKKIQVCVFHWITQLSVQE